MTLSFLFIGTQEFLIFSPILLILALSIYCLVHCLRNNALQGNSKILWLIVILVAPFLGSIIYLLAGKNGNQKLVK